MTELFFCLIIVVTSGDTLTCLTEQHHRIEVGLIGIEAPSRHEPYGWPAREKLADLTLGNRAEIECHGVDQYDRHLCRVMVEPSDCPGCGKTLDVALAMLTIGMARYDPDTASRQPEQERSAYEFAEFDAKARKAGLWLESGARAPTLH